MSNKELEKLQHLLRKEIQTHQILVTKIKSEPHNVELRMNLHDQQAKITALSEKQKKVVEQLRSDLGVRKPSAQHEAVQKVTLLQTSAQPLTTSQHLNIPSRVKANMIGGTTTKLLVAPTATHTTTITTTPITSGGGGVVGGGGGGAQHTPSTPTRLSILTNKPSVISIKVPNISGRLNSLVVKRPVSQNLSKELDYMAKQYKRQFLSTRPKDNPLPSSLSSCVASQSTSSSTLLSSTMSYTTACLKKPLTAEEMKLEFMASIGLVTPKTAETLQSKRSERKRRSTANPQFSKFDKHELESRRSATTYLAAANGWSGEKRRKAARPARFADGVGSENAGINGLPKPDSDGHEDICAVCRQIGELLMCDTCNLVYHLTCLDPPLAAVPPGAWSCPECKLKGKDKPENWQGTLAVVHAFLSHKQSMEDEKKKLGRRAADLRMQRVQLEEKAKHLNDAITNQSKSNESLMTSFRKTEATITQLKDFLTSFQVKVEPMMESQ